MAETPDTPSAPPEGERIAKRLARAGVASRREAERMIAEGRVRVNGRRIDSPALNVTGRDRIEVDGQPLAEAEPARLWRYHKPAGLVTTARDEKGRATVFDRLPPEMPRVMSVGRLDLTSEGLLLLTNDGELKRRLELPSTGWLRRYRVRVHGSPTEAMLAPLGRGIVVEGERFQPMQVAIDRQQGANAWLTIGLREGRNREIRRALEALGLTVNRLIRVSYGPFQLGDLAEGAVEEVKARVLADQLGLARPARPEGARPKSAGGPGPKPAAKGPGQPAGKAPAKGPGRPAGKDPATGSGRPAGKAPGRGPGGGPAKGPARGGGQGPRSGGPGGRGRAGR
ncbi:hypothetical protein LNKW23_26920 [Paralimibaculum aggregatum]|uniref:Pseudouridine synthase n=1 Tax=Paralimibaculum aggregatum TaxID=3036245 RepID=A0ABQ6LJP8_9RHOB|nr:pseudouridine synthase [Limibaculum sp. NKW23]GMG83479.1 hypothetical protein LNKW23_26920 [Limibaculum sp. NKW23]